MRPQRPTCGWDPGKGGAPAPFHCSPPCKTDPGMLLKTSPVSPTAVIPPHLSLKFVPFCIPVMLPRGSVGDFPLCSVSTV